SRPVGEWRQSIPSNPAVLFACRQSPTRPLPWRNASTVGADLSANEQSPTPASPAVWVACRQPPTRLSAVAECLNREPARRRMETPDTATNNADHQPGQSIQASRKSLPRAGGTSLPSSFPPDGNPRACVWQQARNLFGAGIHLSQQQSAARNMAPRPAQKRGKIAPTGTDRHGMLEP